VAVATGSSSCVFAAAESVVTFFGEGQ
jgi:hypothetical protein